MEEREVMRVSREREVRHGRCRRETRTEKRESKKGTFGEKIKRVRG